MKKNNWYVLTGAPSSGKTTILKELEKKGHKVIYEAARTYIDKEMKKGKTLQEIRKDEIIFQHKILQLKIETEKMLSKNQIIFFDRAIPDTIAYYQLYGINKDDFLNQAVKNCFYKKVFMFKCLDYKQDYARIESEDKVEQLQKLLEKSYRKLKIPVIMVPKKSIAQRVNIILNNL